MRRVLGLICFVALCAIPAWAAVGGDVIVHDLKLFVNNQEFFIKGMCYNPTPLGDTGDNNGVGLCSVKRTPFGDWRSACYDHDFWDGSGDVATRYPAGPESWFNPMWERDFPLMKELGVNTVRVYNANPTTKQASIDQLGTPPIVEPNGKDHIPFFNAAEQYGLKIVWPLIADHTLLVTSPWSKIERWLMNQIDEVGNHSALLMYTFGNELPLGQDNPSLVAIVNQGINFTRSYMQTRWNRKVPIISAVVDLPDSYAYLSQALDVDIFATNAGYRGTDFQDLWSGSATWPGWFNLSCSTGKPLFIGEMGWLSLNNSINEQIPNWFNQQWQALIQAIPYGCVGGAFFEYSDEIQKADPLQKALGVVSVSPSTDDSGKTSLMPDMWVPDTVTRKPIMFDSVKNGTVNGTMMNMNMDVFSYLCRQPATLDLTTSDGKCQKPFGYHTSYCTPTLDPTTGATTGMPTTSSSTSGATTGGSSTGAPSSTSSTSEASTDSSTSDGSTSASSTGSASTGVDSTTGSNSGRDIESEVSGANTLFGVQTALFVTGVVAANFWIRG